MQGGSDRTKLARPPLRCGARLNGIGLLFGRNGNFDCPDNLPGCIRSQLWINLRSRCDPPDPLFLQHHRAPFSR